MNTLEMSPGQLLDYLGVDIERWSESFVEHVHAHPGIPTDEGAMLAWFAAAIEAGRTQGRRELCPHPADRLFVSDDLRICGDCGKDLAG